MVDSLVILAYHRVGYPNAEARYKGQFVTPKHLWFQIKCLQLIGYRFCTLGNALQQRGKRAVVTFDDGYRNNLTQGLPVLQRLGIPATVFVVTQDVGKTNVVWSEAGETNPGDLLSWDEIRQLQKHGWEVGSHCSEHVHLAEKTPDVQARLVRASFQALEKELGAGAFPFAYPYGSFDAITAKAVEQAGFSCAVSTLPGDNRAGSERFALRRLARRGYRFDHYMRAVWGLSQIFS